VGDNTTWTCTIEELAQATGGQILSQPVKCFAKVGTDSRADLTGKLFIPLKGDRFDAHDFIDQAVQSGARVLLVHKVPLNFETLAPTVSIVKVGDTMQGLQSLALYWRRKHRYKVLAVTGSNGKTTTKEFTYALLKAHFKVHASKGSLNNHWGVPLSILEAEPTHTHLVLEMGMNHSGELWKLCQIGEPDVAVVTTVGRAHIGELGSQPAIAQAKEEIYVATPKAVHIFNGDNEWTMRMQTRSHTKQFIFSSFKPKADIHLRAQRSNWDGLDVVGTILGVEGQAQVPILGRHNVINLMAAAGLALGAGLTPEQIWKDFSLIRDASWGRNQIVPMKNGARVLFDAYNANPDSVQALIKNLYETELKGRKFLVLGDMRELGSFSEQAHEEAGEKAAAINFEGVWYIGEYATAFWKGFEKLRKPTHKFTSPKVDPGIAREFLNLVQEGDLVSLKASRGMELEKVLEGWPLAAPLGKKP
jgi:UDP-N-acetylmuramoyl-tripeptide--D-alanyl-D-alanine ligase